MYRNKNWPSKKTAFDFERIEKAEQKRARRAAKRLNNTTEKGQ